jgi:hypothetical protein
MTAMLRTNAHPSAQSPSRASETLVALAFFPKKSAK